MLAVLLALVAATTFGSSDFFGGLASRRAPVPAVLLYSHVASVVPLLLALWLLPAAHPTLADYGWGAAAGGIAVIGMILLYLGLSVGPMALVAPVTAVCVAVIPAAAGLAFGERLSRLGLAGLLLGICGVALVSLTHRPAGGGRPTASAGRALVIAIGAGTSLGAFFIVLSRTSQASGLAPLIATRGVTLIAFGAVVGWGALRRRGSARRGSGHRGSGHRGLRAVTMDRRTLATAAVAGVLDMAGNAFYLAAVRNGPLAVVAVLTAFYPAVTVALARVALGERMSAMQCIGTGAAVAAVAMLAVSRA